MKHLLSLVSALRSPLAGLMCAATVLAGCEDGVADSLEPRQGEGEPSEILVDAAAAVELAAGESIVFESLRLLDASGESVDYLEQGDAGFDVAQRVGRPWLYGAEAWVYGERAWSEPGPDGTRIVGYRIVRTPNSKPSARMPSAGPPALDPSLEKALADADVSGGPYAVTITLRNFPDWDVPLLPGAFTLSVVDLEAALEAREQRIAERESLFDQIAADAISAIESAGGKVVGLGRTSGWIAAEVGVDALAALAKRDDLLQVADVGAGQFVTGAWHLGEGRTNTRTYVDTFHAYGYDGDQPNPNRHAWGDIVVGVIEPDAFEDEACFFYSTPGCTGTSRLKKRYRCDYGGADPCQSVTDFPDAIEDDHGNLTASAAVGDYMAGQGNGLALGDPAWQQGTCQNSNQCAGAPCESGLCAHGSQWELRASGMAPRASLIYLGEVPYTSADDAAFAGAFVDSVAENVDVSSNSWGWWTGLNWGTPVADLAHEQEAENAFDDGILVVACGGNSGTGGGYTAWSPGATPKVFTVNGLDTTTAACQADYHDDCLVGSAVASRGGANVGVNGLLYPGAASVVDAAAPGYVTSLTTDVGINGEVLEGSAPGGCSYATPQVAGMGALLKDWYLASGLTWINNPGWLHGLLLMMTDRHRGTAAPTTQGTSGADPVWGLGRMKLRLLGEPPGVLGHDFNSNVGLTFVPGGGVYAYWARSAPLEDDIAVVKCVMLAIEDGSNDTGTIDISNLDLKVDIRDPVSDTCSTSGTLRKSRSDTSKDWTSMVAIEASEIGGANPGLEGKCMRVTVTPVFVESPNVSAKVMCYGAGTDDDAPF